MAEKRKDMKGRNLRTGEYYDEKNQRYMFRKMVAGNRITITAANLLDLRNQAFTYKNYGLGQAEALVLFIVCAIVGVTQVYIGKKGEVAA